MDNVECQKQLTKDDLHYDTIFTQEKDSKIKKCIT